MKKFYNFIYESKANVFQNLFNTTFIDINHLYDLEIKFNFMEGHTLSYRPQNLYYVYNNIIVLLYRKKSTNIWINANLWDQFLKSEFMNRIEDNTKKMLMGNDVQKIFNKYMKTFVMSNDFIVNDITNVHITSGNFAKIYYVFD